MLRHQEECLSECPAELLKFFGSSRELSNYLAGVEDGVEDEDEDEEGVKDGVKDGVMDEDEDDENSFPVTPYIPKDVWYRTQNDIIDPSLRSHENLQIMKVQNHRKIFYK